MKDNELWQQGSMPNLDLMSHKMTHVEYVKLQEQHEQTVFYIDTRENDLGGHKHIAVFEKPCDAKRCVEAVNAIRWRYPADEPFPTDNARYPIQIYGPDFSGVSIAWCNTPAELDGVTMWCPMAPLPEKKP